MEYCLLWHGFAQLQVTILTYQNTYWTKVDVRNNFLFFKLLKTFEKKPRKYKRL